MHRILGPLVFLGSSIVLGEMADIPLHNWTVPPYRASGSGGIQTMTDITSPRLFIGLAVCRLLDTRTGIVYPLDGDGAYGTDEIRTYTLWGACGIPSGADAVSINLTVTNTGSHPFGHLKVWPANQAEPTVSTLNWSTGGVTESNAAIVALSGSGQLRIKSGSTGSDVIMDVNGYFSESLANPVNTLELNTNSPLPSFSIRNFSTACNEDCGLYVRADAGDAVNAWAAGADINYGVDAASSSPAALSAGVRGTGTYKGIYGAIAATFNGAGVFGEENINIPLPLAAGYVASGVRGEGQHAGVTGISREQGVVGGLVNNAGTETAWGVIGFFSGTDPSGGAPPWGLFTGGNIGAAGTKYFLDPDPTDASRVIAYASLEGPEAGTYFRGRSRFQNGLARIPVPEHFRLVTDPEGLTVQITPIGEMASFAVVRMDLNEIVVKGSRNVEFSYLVQGVRETYKDITPFRHSSEFAPRSADARMPAWLSPSQRRRLIENGTYREDGTVNMETARRRGWEKIWEERRRPAPQPAEP